MVNFDEFEFVIEVYDFFVMWIDFEMDVCDVRVVECLYLLVDEF